jgi:hypothetical protein
MKKTLSADAFSFIDFMKKETYMRPNKNYATFKQRF